MALRMSAANFSAAVLLSTSWSGNSALRLNRWRGPPRALSENASLAISHSTRSCVISVLFARASMPALIEAGLSRGCSWTSCAARASQCPKSARAENAATLRVCFWATGLPGDRPPGQNWRAQRLAALSLSLTRGDSERNLSLPSAHVNERTIRRHCQRRCPGVKHETYRTCITLRCACCDGRTSRRFSEPARSSGPAGVAVRELQSGARDQWPRACRWVQQRLVRKSPRCRVGRWPRFRPRHAARRYVICRPRRQ